MLLTLKNKTAVVCGASQGIGKAIAFEFASSGATVILVARNEAALKEIADSLPRNEGQEHSFLVADFSNPAELKERLRSISDTSVDILVNNSGGPPAGKAIDAGVEDYLAAFNQHLICNQVMVQAVAPGMKKKGFGRIINIISTSVKQPIKNLGVSNTTRGAVANWSKTLASELAPYGITVNNILPGATKTERLVNIIKNKSGKTGKSYEECEKEMLEEIPAARFADAKEIAYAASFLASDQASYITGINVPVDGGRTSSL